MFYKIFNSKAQKINNKKDFYGVGALVGYSEGSLTIDHCTVNNSSIFYNYNDCLNTEIGGLVGWIKAIIFADKDRNEIDYGKSGNINFSFCSFINSSITCTNTNGIGRYVGGLYCYAYSGTNNTRSFVIDNCMVVAKCNFTNTSSDGRIYLYGIGTPSETGSVQAQVKKTYENLTYTGENIYIYHLLGKNMVMMLANGFGMTVIEFLNDVIFLYENLEVEQ